MKSISLQSTSRDSSAQFSAPAAEVERLTPTNGPLSSNIGTTTVGAPQKRHQSKPTGLEKWLLRQLLAAIGNPPVVAVLWSGEEVTGGAHGTTPAPEAIRFRVSDRGTLWKILVDPFFQFPEAYCNGRLTFDGDLETLTGLIAESAALSPQGTRLLTYAAKLLHWGGAIRWPPHRSTFNTITTLATIFIVCGWMKACFTRARTSSSRPPRSNRRNVRRWITCAASSNSARAKQ